jgi:hypothetical protein
MKSLILTYTVAREGDKVFYTIFRGEEQLTKREVQFSDLNLFTALFRADIDGEKCIGFCLSLANKLAKKAIRNMLKHETPTYQPAKQDERVINGSADIIELKQANHT